MGFLTEAERINVALTRAEHGLVIIADVDLKQAEASTAKNKSLLDYVYNQVSHSKNISKIIIATTTLSEDEVSEEVVKPEA